jgi:rhodanese-related sulfurtransferase
LNITSIEATNRGLADHTWAMLTTSPAIDEVSPDELENRDPQTLLIDVREPIEYAEGHVPGAVNLPQADLADRLDELPRDQPIYVICQGGNRSLRAAQFLKQMGFERVGSVLGGTAGWSAAGRPLRVGETDPNSPRVIETEWAHARGSNAG